MSRQFFNGARTLTVFPDGRQMITQAGHHTLHYEDGGWSYTRTTPTGEQVFTEYWAEPQDPETWSPR